MTLDQRLDDLQSVRLATAASMLGVAEETLRQAIMAGHLPAWRTGGGHYRILVLALREYIAAQAVGATEEGEPEDLRVREFPA